MELNNLESETLNATETSRLKEAEVLLASLEDYAHRRYCPRPSAYVGKGVFHLKLDEVRSKVYSIEASPDDDQLTWICEKMTLLVNLCRNLELAIRCASEGGEYGQATATSEGIGLCSDTDKVMECLQTELNQRSDHLPVLGPISIRLAKVKAHYLAELVNNWRQQVRWQSSEFPRSQQLVISSDAAQVFQLLHVLRNSAQIATDFVTSILENFIRPLVSDRCVLNITERSSSTLIHSTAVCDRADENVKVDGAHNLQTAYSCLSRIILPLLMLQEDSRELGALFYLLSQRARREPSKVLHELATFLANDLPQTSSLLKSYAVEAEASVEVLQIISEMEHIMVLALEPTEERTLANIPKNLNRPYVISAWVPPVIDHALSLSQNSVVLPVFTRLCCHLTSLEHEALSHPRKAAVFLNNCIYIANRCCLSSLSSSSHIMLLKRKGTSLFLRYVNDHKCPDIPVCLPVQSALKNFTSYIDSLSEMESSWKSNLPFENYSRAIALLFNSFSIGLEAYVFQQKFLTEFEVELLQSLAIRAISLAETWQRSSEKRLQVSATRLTYLLFLLKVNSEEIGLAWRSQMRPLSAVFSAEQVASLAKAKFTVEEFDKLQSVIV